MVTFFTDITAIFENVSGFDKNWSCGVALHTNERNVTSKFTGKSKFTRIFGVCVI